MPLVAHTEEFYDGQLTRMDLSAEVKDDELIRFFEEYTARSLRPHQFFILDNQTSSGNATFQGMKTTAKMLAGAGVTSVRVAYVTSNRFYSVMAELLEEAGTRAGGNVKVDLFSTYKAAEFWLIGEGRNLAVPD